jgi:hypothetical protein
METKINQIIKVLLELETKTKGCYPVFFEYGNGLFTIRIYKGEVSTETIVYERIINPVQEEEKLTELSNSIKNFKNHITTTVFQCYKQVFVKGELSGKWEKTGSVIQFGENATSEMLIDGSGYYITDPENNALYFVDRKQLSETNK